MNIKQFRNALKIASLYIAATIGAGFASGKEIFLFFTKYEDSSKYAITFTGLLFILIGFVILDYIRIHKPDNMNDLFTGLVGKKLSIIFSLLISLFLVGVLSIMLSGMANIVMEIFEISYHISGILVTLLCFVILIFGIKAIVTLSEIVTPLLIIGITFLSILLLKTAPTAAIHTSSTITYHWGISAIIYIAYNILITVVVLIDAKYLLTSRNITILSSILGGIGLFSTSYLINLVLLKYYSLIIYEELPMLVLAKLCNQEIFYTWSIILFLSMLTTAVSSALGCINIMVSKIKLPRVLIIFIYLSFTLRLTYVGFSQLITIVYPFFGYVGIILILLLAFRYARSEKI